MNTKQNARNSGDITFSRPLNIIFSFFTLALVIVGILIFNSQRSDVINKYHSLNQKFVKNIEIKIQKSTSELENALRENIQVVERNESAGGYDSDNVKIFMMNKLRVTNRALSIVVANMKGDFYRIPEKKTSKDTDDFDTRDRPWFINGFDATNNPRFTEPYTDIVTGKKIVSLSLPFFNSNSTIGGVIAYDIDIKTYTKSLKMISPPVRGSIYILTSNGATIAGTSKEESTSINRSIINKIHEKNGFFYLKANKAYYYYSSTDNPEWLTIYKVEKKDILNLAFKDSVKIVYGIIISLFILVLFWWWTRVILSKIYFRIAADINYGSDAGNPENPTEHLSNAIRKATSKMNKIKENAYIDSLTGLKNRRALDEKMDEIKSSPGFFIAVIDIDNFKFVNDNYGHEFGDFILKVVADIGVGLKGDFVDIYRYGGEEIVIIFSNTSCNDARIFIESWLSCLRDRRFREDNNLIITFSAGLCSMEQITPKDALIQADKCMYLAKKQGKNRIVTPAD